MICHIAHFTFSPYHFIWYVLQRLFLSIYVYITYGQQIPISQHLTYRRLVPHVLVSKQDHHWFHWCGVAYWAPSNYPNQWWVVVNRTPVANFREVKSKHFLSKMSFCCLLSDYHCVQVSECRVYSLQIDPDSTEPAGILIHDITAVCAQLPT